MKRLAASLLIACGCSSLQPAFEYQDSSLARSPGSGSLYFHSREEGERMLSLLSREGNEEAFLYSSGEWLDVGVEEKERHVTFDVDVVERYIRLHFPEDITFYHLHPGTDSSIPSFTDLVLHKKLKERFPGIRITSKAVSPCLCWEYDTTGSLPPAPHHWWVGVYKTRASKLAVDQGEDPLLKQWGVRLASYALPLE